MSTLPDMTALTVGTKITGSIETESCRKSTPTRRWHMPIRTCMCGKNTMLYLVHQSHATRKVLSEL